MIPVAGQTDRSLFSVHGRIALVTGASSGLGRAAASILAGAGARVVGLARRESALSDWQRSCGGDTATVVADLTDRAGLAKTVERATRRFGSPEILINTAGINTREAADDVTEAGWDQTIEINLSAPFFLAKALVPAMRASGWGRIVNFASLQSRRAFPGGIAYGASKGGIEQLTRAMAEAWSDSGIMVNALAPGFFPTELTAPVFADRGLAKHHAGQTCIGRNGEPGDLAGPFLFFCSDATRYVSGQVLFVDGGYTAK